MNLFTENLVAFRVKIATIKIMEIRYNRFSRQKVKSKNSLRD